MTKARDLANLASVNLPNTYVTQSSASTVYATKTSPVFAGTANFANASVIFNSASVSGLSSGGTTVNSNLLYNGAMQIHQRSTSVAGISSAGYYTADRWATDPSLLGTWTQTVEVDAPSGSGFRKSLKVLCTTADASPSAGDYFLVQQRLEGQDLQRIAKGTANAQPLTLSFWVKSNTTGTYVSELYDADNSRGVSFSYTISSSATWERKVITFPADTTGVLDNDNAVSLYVFFWLGAGSNYTGGSPLQTTWGTATNTRATGQTNLGSSINNYWQITGVQLEIGLSASPFEFKSFGQELRECQRYYLQINATTTDAPAYTGGVQSTTRGDMTIPLPVTMRIGPSPSIVSGTPRLDDYFSVTSNITSIVQLWSTNTVASFQCITSGLTTGRPLKFATAASGTWSIGLSAEL